MLKDAVQLELPGVPPAPEARLGVQGQPMTVEVRTPEGDLVPPAPEPEEVA